MIVLKLQRARFVEQPTTVSRKISSRFGQNNENILRTWPVGGVFAEASAIVELARGFSPLRHVPEKGVFLCNPASSRDTS